MERKWVRRDNKINNGFLKSMSKLVYDESWRKEEQNQSFAALITYLETEKFGEMRQITLKKVDKLKVQKYGFDAWYYSEEPNYLEKLDALKNLGQWKQIGLEVFPTIENLVDAVNLYHVWELQSKNAFPFEIYPIMELPELDQLANIKEISAEYAIKTYRTQYGPVAYLYLKAEKELIWRQKQALKNEIIGEDLTAVEMICEEAKDLKYSCLICLPMNYELDFTV